MLSIMDFIDGSNSLVDIAERAGVPVKGVADFVDRLREAGLVDAVDQPVPVGAEKESPGSSAPHPKTEVIPAGSAD